MEKRDAHPEGHEGRKDIMMNIGDWIDTPRFCKVRIDAIFADAVEAAQTGYTEPTYFQNSEWMVKGKSIDRYTMRFAAVSRNPLPD